MVTKQWKTESFAIRAWQESQATARGNHESECGQVAMLGHHTTAIIAFSVRASTGTYQPVADIHAQPNMRASYKAEGPQPSNCAASSCTKPSFQTGRQSLDTLAHAAVTRVYTGSASHRAARPTLTSVTLSTLIIEDHPAGSSFNDALVPAGAPSLFATVCGCCICGCSCIGALAYIWPPPFRYPPG